MPYKSRKNRRSDARDRIAASISTGAAANIQSTPAAGQPVKNNAAYSSIQKTTAPTVPDKSIFLAELKWITLVTVTIAILLVVSYYIFR